MDVVSDAVTAMRTGRPRSARVEWRAPWAKRYPSVPGAGFHVLLQGSCWLLPEVGDAVRLDVGDVVLLPHGHGGHVLADSVDTPLSSETATPVEIRWAAVAGPDEASSRTNDQDHAQTTVLLCGAYQLEQRRPHPFLAALPTIVHLPARTNCHSSLGGAVNLLAAELDDPRPGTDAAVSSLLDTLLLYMIRAWMDECPEDRKVAGWIAALDDPGVTAALHAIHQAPARAWTVEALARHAGQSRATFARRFTELTGMPPLSYLIWWRMTRAAEELRLSDAPISAIAGRVGYTSEYAFANAFKREHGIAPGRFRREHARAGTSAWSLEDAT